MNHALIEAKPGELGFGCKCGKRFPTKKTADQHAADQNLIEENEAKAQAERQAQPDVHQSKPEPASSSESADSENEAATAPREPTDEPKAALAAPAIPEPAKEPEKPQAPAAPSADMKSARVSASTRSLATSINSMDMADQMVLKYATTLINSDAAAEFQTHMKLIRRVNPKLANVTAQSLFMAMMACVHLRLMPNTTEQLAFIIPYGNEAQF